MERINRDETILLNIVKMLTARGLLLEKDMESNYKNLIKQKSEEMTYKIKSYNNITYNIMFVYGKLSTIKKISGLDLFINESKGQNRIFIVDNVNQKAYKQFLEYRNTEVFFDYELLINLIEHELQPKFEVLNEQQKKEFYEMYDIEKKDMAKMETIDPVARYFNLSQGDIIKCIRPSISAGNGFFYRYVKEVPISNFFET